MQRIAIIDMGTNTFHLLVAALEPKGYWKIIHRDIEAVKLGKSGINEGFITENAALRALQAMVRFAETLKRLDVATVHAYGTSAFRNARNAAGLITDILTQTGIAVQVISGDKEADLIFSGASAALNIGAQPALVMDIGAGSVEFIIGNEERVLWKQSFEIGGQRLVERFQKHDPIIPDEIAALDAHFDDTLVPLWEACSTHQPDALIGSSGTFDTLSEIFCIQEKIEVQPDAAEIPLSIEGFHRIHRDLLTRNREARMLIPGMIELRVDMIVVTACLIRYVLEKHPFKRIRVSTYSLKEGALAQLAPFDRLRDHPPAGATLR